MKNYIPLNAGKSFNRTISLLIEKNGYEFLNELGLKPLNAGVYDGQWNANGEVILYPYFFFIFLLGFQ